MSPAQFYVRRGLIDVTVTIEVDGLLAGTVSANEHPMLRSEYWWLSRLKLDRSCRGRGIAEQALATLIEALATHGGSKVLQVCPGGYDSHLPSLMRWYRIQGFRQVDGQTFEYDLSPSSAVIA